MWLAWTQRCDQSSFNAPAYERFQRFLKASFTPGAVHTAKNNLDQNESSGKKKKYIFNSGEVKCIKAIKGNYKRRTGFGRVNV